MKQSAWRSTHRLVPGCRRWTCRDSRRCILRTISTPSAIVHRRRKACTDARLCQSRRRRRLAWHPASKAASPPPLLRYRRARCSSAASSSSAILPLKKLRTRPLRSNGHTRPALRRQRRRARFPLRCRQHRLQQRTHTPGHLPHSSSRTHNTRTICPCQAARPDMHPAFPAAGPTCRRRRRRQSLAQCSRRCHCPARRPSQHRCRTEDGRPS